MTASVAVPLSLSVQQLEIWRGDRCLCRDLTFQLAAGAAIHVQGPNGSGKTTLIRVLTGIGRADDGEVRWCGYLPEEDKADYRAAIAYVGHGNGVKLGLTPRENIAVAIALLAQSTPVEVDPVLVRVGLERQADLPCGMLSMGQRRRTALARLLLGHVPLWFLDEPLTSLDTAGVTLITDMLKQHLAGGGLAVFASHQQLDLRPFPVQPLILGADP